VLVGLAGFVAGTALGCGVDDLDPGGGPPTSIPPGTILIVDDRFLPAELTVDVGFPVTWVNLDERTHRIASLPNERGADVLDSGEIGKDATYTRTFRRPGTYRYYCEIHNYEKGTVTVR
jgi:hypothetical protein